MPKKLLPLLGLLLLLGCQKPDGNAPLSGLCENQQTLLVDARHNWRMVLDTLPNADAYLAMRITQLESIMDSLQGAGWSPHMDSVFDPLPFLENTESARWEYLRHREQFYFPCFPFVLIDGVPVSTEPLRVPTGAYQRPEKSLFMIPKTWVDSAATADSVTAFFLRTWDHPGHFLSFGNRQPLQMFPNLLIAFSPDCVPLMRTACHGYLAAIETRSKTRYDKEICELDVKELDTLQKLYPLEISIMNRPVK
jgi:hypothetical protein